MENYKKTTKINFINGVPYYPKEIDNTTRFILNASQFIRMMISNCDMFRLKFADYNIVWYKNGNKARLTISKSIL